MLKAAFLILVLSQLLHLGLRWMHVTTRNHDASDLRRMRDGLDWHGEGHRRRTTGGRPRAGWIWR